MAATRIMLGSSSYGSIRWKPPLLHHRYSFRLSLPVVQPLSPAGSVKFDRYRRRKSNIGGLTCLLSNPNSSSKEEESSWKKLLQSFARSILKKTAISAALLLMGLLVVYNSNQALAASGGRMGRRSFSSSSSSSTGSYSTRKARPPEFSYTSMPYYAPSPFGSSGGGGFYVGPAFGVGPGSGSFLIFLSFTAFVVVSGFLSDRSEGSVLTDAEKASILKLQVGLLGTGRSLQRDLNRIAETADTSTSEGLHYVLTETSLALLRHPSYCISAYSSVDVLRGMEEGEERFNELSIEERGKFDEETLVNVNNNMVKKKMQQITTTTIEGGGGDTTSGGGGGGGFSNEYIVITMLVAAEGGVDKLPAMNGSGDLKQGLEKLASIPATKTLAVEVLWTPQNEDDSLSETQLLQDYPLLRPL